MMFSWPSAEKTTGYTIDENNARWSQEHFAEFLELVRTKLGLSRCMSSLTAWATGCSPRRSPTTDREGAEIHRVMFAAPDIDAAPSANSPRPLAARLPGSRCTPRRTTWRSKPPSRYMAKAEPATPVPTWWYSMGSTPWMHRLWTPPCSDTPTSVTNARCCPTASCWSDRVPDPTTGRRSKRSTGVEPDIGASDRDPGSDLLPDAAPESDAGQNWRAAAAQWKPAPNAVRTTRSPATIRAVSRASHNANGTDADPVLPYSSTLT